MLNNIKRLHWFDVVLLIALTAFAVLVWYRIEGALNYKWRWEIIPNYILPEHELRSGIWRAWEKYGGRSVDPEVSLPGLHVVISLQAMSPNWHANSQAFEDLTRNQFEEALVDLLHRSSDFRTRLTQCSENPND